MDAGLQNMIGLAQQKPLAPQPGATSDAGRADKSSKDYESVFISQFLGSMFSSIPTDSITGGGQGEEMFRSLMVDQYAKGIENQGGFGIASRMKAELLKHQQVASQ
jgi:Rod binding domain-containing protein